MVNINETTIVSDEFEIYFTEAISKFDRLNYNYLGISRKEFPKWQGWQIINAYKEQNVEIRDIEDRMLEVLVRNFYYLKYIQEKF